MFYYPAIQKPSSEPVTPTNKFTGKLICVLAFITTLASQPTIPPTIKEISQPMSTSLEFEATLPALASG